MSTTSSTSGVPVTLSAGRLLAVSAAVEGAVDIVSGVIGASQGTKRIGTAEVVFGPFSTDATLIVRSVGGGVVTYVDKLVYVPARLEVDPVTGVPSGNLRGGENGNVLGIPQFSLNSAAEAVALAYAGKNYNTAVLAVKPSGDVTGATDTANIQAAIAIVAASSTAKGGVELAGGTFYLKGTFAGGSAYAAIQLASNVDIIGRNSAKVKLMTSTQPDGSGAHVFIGVSVSNIRITDVEIDGNRSNFVSPPYASPIDGVVGSGVRLTSCTDVTVNRCWVHSNIFHGLMAVEASQRVHFDYNRVSDQGYRAMHFNVANNANTLSDCTYNFNYQYANGQAADNIDNSGAFPVLGQCVRVQCNFNTIEDEVHAGIDIGGALGGGFAAREFQAIGNIIKGCKVGIRTGGSPEGAMILQNQITGCTQAGILAGQSINCKYDYNTIRRTVGGGTSGGHGVQIGATGADVLQNCSFDHNHVIDNQGNTSNRTAVYLNTGAHVGLSISHNHIINNGVTDGSTAGGIQTNPSAGRIKSLRVCNNTIRGNKGHAIVLYNTDNAIVANNQIMDNFEASGPRGFGVSLSGTADGTLIYGNVCLNDNVSNSAVQIKLDATATNSQVYDNVAESAASAPITATEGATGTYSRNKTNGIQSWSSVMLPAHGLTKSVVLAGSAVSLTTATSANITSISLTPGTWDVSGSAEYVLTGSTSTLHQLGISATTNTLPSQAGGSGIDANPLVAFPIPTVTLSGTLSQTIGPTQVVLTATTTIYLVAQATFSAGTETAYGSLRARLVD